MTRKIIKLRETLNLIKANQPYTTRLKPMVINSGLLVLTNFSRINNSFSNKTSRISMRSLRPKMKTISLKSNYGFRVMTMRMSLYL